MSLNLIQDEEAWKQLEDQEFRAAWLKLFAVCPWSTAFQTPEFLVTWYKNYRADYSPLVVWKEPTHDQAGGLLFLARHGKTGELALAGTHQAEYQVWLAEPKEGERFVTEALDAVRARFPGKSLTFRYLPAAAPTGWARGASAWSANCAIEAWRRPIVRLNDETFVKDYLAQKRKRRSTKSYYNQLRKIGELEFTRVEDQAELREVIDELISYYDSRQLAMHGEAPFHDDCVKREFHLDMMRQRGLLHVTVFRAGGKIVSAQFGIASGKELILAMPIFSPFFAEQSPITLHYLLLVEKAVAEGYQVLDMTPGESGFKDRFATDQEYVHVLRVYFLPWQRQLRTTRLAAEELLRAVLRRVKISPTEVRERISSWKKSLAKIKWQEVPKYLGNRFQRVGRKIYSLDESRIYLIDKTEIEKAKNLSLMRRDSVEDLIHFVPVEHWQDRQNFVRESLHRMERKQHSYTCVENDRRVHFGWLDENQKEAVFPEVGQRLMLPPGTAVLYDFYTDPAARGKGLYKTAMTQMLHDAAETGGVKRMLIAVLAANRASRRAIEHVGFVYAFSLYRSVSFGRQRTSTSPLPEGWTAVPNLEAPEESETGET